MQLRETTALQLALTSIITSIHHTTAFR